MRLAVLGAIMTLLACGCSGGIETYPVTGRVTFPDGKPLKGGTVEFQPLDPVSAEGDGGGFSARGAISEDGSFQLSTFRPGDGVVLGRHRALIVPPLPPGRIDPTRRPPPVIAEKFLSYGTSGLEFTVTEAGPNDFQITVEPPR